MLAWGTQEGEKCRSTEGLRKALAVFFMFILLISQVRYYHLHFTHRETGLREHKGLLGHVALRGQIWTQTSILPVSEVLLFLGYHTAVVGGQMAPTNPENPVNMQAPCPLPPPLGKPWT